MYMYVYVNAQLLALREIASRQHTLCMYTYMYVLCTGMYIYRYQRTAVDTKRDR